MPWEQGIRVRMGNRVRKMEKGVYLKLPFIDAVYIQSVRRRMQHLPTQTVCTRDGKTVTLGGAVGYSIADIHRLYSTVHDAAATIANVCQCAIAEVVLSSTTDACSPAAIAAEATKLVKFDQYGLSEAEICITDFAFVKTFRIINDQRYGCGGNLDISMPTTNTMPSC